MKPKVSVATVAYNHVNLVRQSVESALSQKADFPFEIVIGEDCSTDGTRELLQQMQKEHPDKIRLILREQNLGMQWNFARTLEACEGEYIAVLDSDDYWTSEEKLAKQARFMDEHPEHAISFHRTDVLFENEPERRLNIPSNPKPVSDIEDIAFANMLASCATMFRRDRLPAFPDWYAEVHTYDWVLATLILINGGTVGFLDETMAVYRVHGSNLYSRLDERSRLEKELKYYDYLLPLIPERALANARLGKADRLYDLANNYRRTGERGRARDLFAEALSLESEGHRLPWRRKMRMKVRLALGL